MADLTSRRLIFLKGWLFLLGGLLVSLDVLLEAPTLRVAALLGIAIWCFCRFYYFAFYVIERYADPSYRFAGLLDFANYYSRRKRRSSPR